MAKLRKQSRRRQWIAGMRWYLSVSSVDQMQWEVSLWVEVFPRAVGPQEDQDEDFWLHLLEPEDAVQEVGQMLAIMDAPDQEVPTEDRPNPHAGVRIGEASNPGPPAAGRTAKRRIVRLLEAVQLKDPRSLGDTPRKETGSGSIRAIDTAGVSIRLRKHIIKRRT
eukprot:2874086-Heterocapsa_arctica.AAC.1